MNLEILTKEDLDTFEKRILATLKAATPSASKETWMNLKQAAAYIKDKPCTLGEKVRKGEIAHIRDGRIIKFRVSDLDAYLMAHRVMSNDEIATAASARG